MSAKGRGVRERSWYPTPAWPVHRLLEVLDLGRCTTWIEPMAGDGSIIEAVEDYFFDAAECGPFDRKWTAVELDRRFADPLRKLAGPKHTHIEDIFDFLEDVHEDADPTGEMPMWDVAITNPPFSMAQKLVTAFAGLAETLIVLQRLNWLETPGRLSFFRSHQQDVYVLPNRPQFQFNKQGKLGADATAYGWFVFGRGKGRYHLLNETSDVVLKEARRHQIAALTKWNGT